MDAYAGILRPLLFRLTADHAHALARLALRWSPIWRLLGGSAPDDARLHTDLAGIPLHTPIGLAPGFDKSGELLAGLSQLGFGYVMAGSVTEEPRAGNPFPRLVRYVDKQSISNSMGLPNPGLAEAARYLGRAPVSPPVIVSVAGFSAAELVQCAATLEPLVTATEIGLVCPNTTETERLEELRMFNALLDELANAKKRPVFIKLPPHHDDEHKRHVMAMVDACLQAGIEGVSVSGSQPIAEPGLGMGRGSLAGKAVFPDALRIVRDVAGKSGGRLAIKGAGGVFTGRDAFEMLSAGATTVELYSAFIYRGWNVGRQIATELSDELDSRGLSALPGGQPAGAR